MKIIRKTLDNLSSLITKNKILGKFKPILTAVDEFFFGTDKTTKLPHILDHIDIKRFMTTVIIALIPVTLASIYFWGPRVIIMILVSYTFGGLIETAFAIIRKKEIHEGFLVTGLIFPLILPPTTPLWAVALGVMFGVFFGKEVFGGTGRNIFNPAIVGRIFLSVTFPSIMTTQWRTPIVDAVTSATPLTLFKSGKVITPYMDLLFGYNAGCVGETFRIGIILGGLYLIFVKIIDWRTPTSYLLSVAGFTFLCNTLFGTHFAPVLFQLLSGGLLLGAFFMATDPVTAPFTKAGRWIGGFLLGILTVLIRGLSGYVEGVMFSILLVNAVSPLIDTLVLKVRYRKK